MIRPSLVLAAATTCLGLVVAGSALAAQPYPIDFHSFDLRQGSTAGLTLSKGTLTLSTKALVSAPYVDPYANVNGDGVDGSGTYQSGTWTSPVYTTSFPFNELVSSWNAKTPAGTFIQ